MESNATVQDIDSVTRQAKVSIPSTKLAAEVDTALVKYTKQAKVKGFRPGKAPRQMVEKLYGESIRWDVVSKLVSSELQSVIKQNELQMVGNPKIDITVNEPGKDLEFVADFSIYPTPKISGYDGLKVSVEKDEVTDEQVTKVVDSYRRQKANVKKVEGRDAVQADDVIDISVTFKAKDGTETTPENATIGLGDGRLPKEFDDQVIGLKIGETKDITLAGGESGELVYEVTLNGISERELPEFNDEFVLTLGVDEKTALELKQGIRSKLTEQADGNARERAKANVIDTLIELNEFKVPQPLIDDEIRQMLIRVGAVNAQNTKFEDIPAEPFRDSFGEMAAKRVKGSIILDMVAQAENITPNDEDMKKAFEEVAAEYKVSELEARKMFHGRALLNLAVEVTRHKTHDFLVDKANIDYKPKSEKSE